MIYSQRPRSQGSIVSRYFKPDAVPSHYTTLIESSRTDDDNSLQWLASQLGSSGEIIPASSSDQKLSRTGPRSVEQDTTSIGSSILGDLQYGKTLIKQATNMAVGIEDEVSRLSIKRLLH